MRGWDIVKQKGACTIQYEILVRNVIHKVSSTQHGEVSKN